MIPLMEKILQYSFLVYFILTPAWTFGQAEKSFRAHSIDRKITVDGYLNESMWEKAEPATNFLQLQPEEGTPATQKTEVRVLYGNGNLYVGAVLHDDNSSSIRDRLTRRDNYNRADWFIASIDSDFNQRTAYTFGVNAAGVKLDALQEGSSRNYSWDAVWDSSVRRKEDGWAVEMRIPYSMLRFPEEKAQSWGIHFTRKIPRLGEISEWPLIPRVNRSNLVANYGVMTGITDIEPQPNIQVRPYSLARLKTEEDYENPGTVVTTRSADLGGNMKVGLGPSTTLDVAVNPDFGQIESDPAVLNLDAFEVFFDEKRPFFVEGQQYYQFGISGGDLFYSRRIGSVNPIVGASKLSGRTGGGLSFGVLGATTGEDFTPSRGYGVARVSQQFDKYSSFGGTVTIFQGPDSGSGTHGRSVAGGSDWDLRFKQNEYAFRGYGAFTHQRSKGESQTPKTGLSGQIEIEKQEGEFRFKTNTKATEKTFDPNNVGQLTKDRRNFAEVFTTYDYNLMNDNNSGIFRRITTGGSFAQTYSTDEWISRRQFIIFKSEFVTKSSRNINISGRLFNFTESYDLYETRGLWPRSEKYRLKTGVEYSTDDKREWEISSSINYTTHGSGGKKYSMSLKGDWNAGDHVYLSGSISGQWSNEVLAWSSNESIAQTRNGWSIGNISSPPTNLEEEEYTSIGKSKSLERALDNVPEIQNNYYYVPIYGRRNTRSLNLTVRSTVSFTPKMSLEMYSQVFMARGNYDEFKLLARRDEMYNFTGFPKSNVFENNKFQSNVVFRWRFREGSTLYLVWDKNKNLDKKVSEFGAKRGAKIKNRSVGTRLSDVMREIPENRFIVKVEYNLTY